MTTPRHVGTREFMEMYGFKSRPDLYRKAAQGRIPGAFKFEGRWKFDIAAYEEATTRAMIEPPTPTRRIITAKPGRRPKQWP